MVRSITHTVTLRDLEIREQRYAPGARLDWHRHDAPEVCLLQRGSFREALCGDREIDYHPLDMSYKPCDVEHCVTAGSAGATCLVIVMDRALPPDLFSDTEYRNPRVLRSHPTVAALGLQALQELRHQDACSGRILEHLALAMVSLLGRSLRPEGGPAWAPAARDLLRRERPGHADLDRAATALGITRSVLSAGFRQAFGVGPAGYLRLLQVEHARRLLANGALSLAEVAYQSGYCDQAHLTRAYKAATGTTPAAFRRDCLVDARRVPVEADPISPRSVQDGGEAAG